MHTTDQLLGRGLTSQALSRAVASGDLIRLRPGFYVERSASSLPREERHLLSVLAADKALDSPIFSHSSAALLLGLPGWGLPLRRVALSGEGDKTRTRSTSRTKHHTVPISPEEVVGVGGLRVTSAERTVVDIALSVGRDASVAVADAALKLELATELSLNLALQQAAGRRGINRARSALAMADGLSESVAETLSRLTFSDFGLPEPEMQVDIFSRHGDRVARVDFLWREFGVIGECDGFGKYFDGVDQPETRRRLAKEKDRDAELMALGYRVIHWRWADIVEPRFLAERVRRVLYPAAA